MWLTSQWRFFSGIVIIFVEEDGHCTSSSVHLLLIFKCKKCLTNSLSLEASLSLPIYQGSLYYQPKHCNVNGKSMKIAIAYIDFALLDAPKMGPMSIYIIPVYCQAVLWFLGSSTKRMFSNLSRSSLKVPNLFGNQKAGFETKHKSHERMALQIYTLSSTIFISITLQSRSTQFSVQRISWLVWLRLIPSLKLLNRNCPNLLSKAMGLNNFSGLKKVRKFNATSSECKATALGMARLKSLGVF